MKTRQALYTLTAVAFVALAGSGAMVACSSDNNNGPGPTNDDSGADVTASSSGSGSSSSSGASGSSSGSSSGTDSGGSSSGTDSGGSSSGASCTPDGGTGAKCNSCATIATDSLNACSPFATGCTPFDNSVVPDGGMKN